MSAIIKKKAPIIQLVGVLVRLSFQLRTHRGISHALHCKPYMSLQRPLGKKLARTVECVDLAPHPSCNLGQAAVVLFGPKSASVLSNRNNETKRRSHSCWHHFSRKLRGPDGFSQNRPRVCKVPKNEILHFCRGAMFLSFLKVLMTESQNWLI